MNGENFDQGELEVQEGRKKPRRKYFGKMQDLR
jgi:hypothetical protein